ncbi:MAG: adenosylcobalamin-dependent ribonucleoside-diphosphate reductase [Novosphingobium sp.]|nr:adenosylcobalamin-dependent ribonucleoside-diphosphate reductase [Novosphingobium sp.]
MKIDRVYTKKDLGPFNNIKFEVRKSKITEPNGKVIFEMDNVEVPAHWSQIATDVLAQKYFRKAGVPSSTEARLPEDDDRFKMPLWLRRSFPAKNATFGSEKSAKQVFHRLAGCWTYWGWKEKYFDTEEDARTFYDELMYMLAMQIFAPNSPQWFNTGLNWAYGITGPPQGHYYFDKEKNEVVESRDAYSRPQPHACFIQKIEDHLVEKNGIMHTWWKEARLFKQGSGSGLNFSELRGTKEPLDGGGVSSGLMSWLKIGDVAAGSIKSGGTTRRAATMRIVDIDHPDIEDFIDWKVKEEEKVAALITGSKINKHFLQQIIDTHQENYRGILDDGIKDATRNGLIAEARQVGVPERYIQKAIQLAKQGVKEWPLEEFNNDWQGEAYRTVSGQNSNNSVSITNAFMQAVEEDTEWDLVWRTEKQNIEDGKRRHPDSIKTVEAKELWDKICYSAWSCADPGLFFYDTVNDWNTVVKDGNIRGANPCSEYIFLDDTACNLASINLVKYFTNGRFDYRRYVRDSRLLGIVLDISVQMAQFPSYEIALNSYKYRPLGLGYANLGALLMRMAIPYDSSDALRLTSALTALMHLAIYRVSIDMAKELSPFPRYEENKESMLRVITKHIKHAREIFLTEEEKQFLLVLCHDVLSLGSKYGFRNAYVTNIAPTGTIGLVMDCDTTGIEPDYALIKFKKLAGGGVFKIINQSVAPALKNLGYKEDEIERIEKYLIEHNTIKGAPHLKEEYYNIFECANEINYNAHINIMAAASPFLSGSISKTINMPNDATIEDVSKAYMKAWRLGIKAIALYRDGSKLSQPLETFKTEKNQKLDVKTELIKDIQMEVDKEMLNPQKDVEDKFFMAAVDSVKSRKRLPNKRIGYTQKAKIAGQSLYIRTGEYIDGSLGEIFIDIHREGATLRSLLNCFSIAVSLGLQHGVPLEEFVDAFTFTKFEPSGPVQGHDRIKMTNSIIDYIFRDLAISYLKREDLAHVSVDEHQGQLQKQLDMAKKDIENWPNWMKKDSDRFGPKEKTINEVLTDANILSKGYTGDVCQECHNVTMVRNGTCLKCMSCGSTTGCS